MHGATRVLVPVAVLATLVALACAPDRGAVPLVPAAGAGAGASAALGAIPVAATFLAGESPATRLGKPWTRRSLEPVTDPAPLHGPHPERLRPSRVVTSADGRRAWITLLGKEIAPGHEVLVLDVPRGEVAGRIEVGRAPFGIALHPSGKWLVVTNRYSNFLSVVDVEQGAVVSEIPVPFYCEDLVLTREGDRAYVTNFWKRQVLVVDLEVREGHLVGELRDLGMARSFVGSPREQRLPGVRCRSCGLEAAPTARCPRCGGADLEVTERVERLPDSDSPRQVLRARCGSAPCHMERRAGFYAGADDRRALRSAMAHVAPGDPEASVLLRATVDVDKGGLHGLLDGRHHPGGVVFEDPAGDPDLAVLREWVRDGMEGPGIPTGAGTRDLTLSDDGSLLFVANNLNLDVTVIDTATLRPVHRIYTQTTVNDVLWLDDRVVMAALGSGSGHPEKRDPVREAYYKKSSQTTFSHRRWHGEYRSPDYTNYRSRHDGRSLPLERQDPLGPFDAVDGVAQEGPRDISNDLILTKPFVDDVHLYQATEDYTRWCADSFEAMPADVKGSVPAELQQVVGAFPEQMVRRGERLYVTMYSTFELQEWVIDLDAPPAERLRPARVFETGMGPVGLDVAGSTLVVANQLEDTVSLIDLESGESREVVLDPELPPYPASDFERGEVLTQSSLFMPDLDIACVSCHYRNIGDGKRWSQMGTVGLGYRGEVRFGGSRSVAGMRLIRIKEPFLWEAIESAYDLRLQLQSLGPLIDYQGVVPAGDFRGVFATPEDYDNFRFSALTVEVPGMLRKYAPDTDLRHLLARRRQFLNRQGERYLGVPIDLAKQELFIGRWLEGEPRVWPNPVDPEDPMVKEGEALFKSPETACAACHPPPTFRETERSGYPNGLFPPLVTGAPRDNGVTLISPRYMDRVRYKIPIDPEGDQGRIEYREGFFVAPTLRAIWSRAPSFLHHGHAVNLREVLCTPGHPALRRFPFERLDIERPGRWEVGKNELEGVPDMHGGTSHLSVWELECLLAYVRSIE